MREDKVEGRMTTTTALRKLSRWLLALPDQHVPWTSARCCPCAIRDEEARRNSTEQGDPAILRSGGALASGTECPERSPLERPSSGRGTCLI